jgi:hypothetical protein
LQHPLNIAKIARDCSAAPVSGLSDLEGTLFAFMIGREDIGSTAALPARCLARARIAAWLSTRK